MGLPFSTVAGGNQANRKQIKQIRSRCERQLPISKLAILRLAARDKPGKMAWNLVSLRNVRQGASNRSLHCKLPYGFFR